MTDAFAHVTKQTVIKYKQNEPIYQDAVALRHLDRDLYLDRVSNLRTTEKTAGYLNRLKRHNKFFNHNKTTARFSYIASFFVIYGRYKYNLPT